MKKREGGGGEIRIPERERYLVNHGRYVGKERYSKTKKRTINNMLVLKVRKGEISTSGAGRCAKSQGWRTWNSFQRGARCRCRRRERVCRLGGIAGSWKDFDRRKGVKKNVDGLAEQELN